MGLGILDSIVEKARRSISAKEEANSRSPYVHAWYESMVMCTLRLEKKEEDQKLLFHFITELGLLT